MVQSLELRRPHFSSLTALLHPLKQLREITICRRSLLLHFLKDEAWAAGGSGILLRAHNGGKSWIRDKAADNIAANLYSVKFIDDKKGFVYGNDGVFLRYLG